MRNNIFAFAMLVCANLLVVGCQPRTTATSLPTSEISVASATASLTLQAATAPVKTPQPPVANPAPTPGEILGLENQVWQLKSYQDASGALKKVLENTKITAEFNRGQISGSAGCNNYFASYQLNADRLTVANPGSTLMACMTPDGVMVQEAAYLDALQKSATFQIQVGQLEIADQQGKIILVFTVEPPTTLVGNLWQLGMYAQGVDALVSPLAGTQITALFGSDGTLVGTAGCNLYNSAYTVDASGIVIPPLATTRKTCPVPPGVMEQEAAYLALIQGVSSYQVKGQELHLSDSGGRKTLIFTAISDATEASMQKQADQASLSLESLKNMDYRCGFTVSGRALLNNGEYREAGAPGSAVETVVKLVEPVAYGELPDGRLAVAVVLSTETGGSGTFYELGLVVDLNGAPLNVASVFLGDRIQVNSLKIENGELAIDLVKQAPDDPMCCPTLHVLQKYALQGADLALVSNEEIK